MHITKLIFSGGGSKSIMFLGALNLLINEKFLNLNNIDTFIGISAGAILSLLFCIGYTIDELSDFIMHLDFEKLENITDTTNFIDYYGFDNGKK